MCHWLARLRHLREMLELQIQCSSCSCTSFVRLVHGSGLLTLGLRIASSGGRDEGKGTCHYHGSLPAALRGRRNRLPHPLLTWLRPTCRSPCQLPRRRSLVPHAGSAAGPPRCHWKQIGRASWRERVEISVTGVQTCALPILPGCGRRADLRANYLAGDH